MDGQEADDTRNFASDAVSGYNVNSIAIEVPISMLTRTGTKVAATNPAATIGTWGVTSRQRVRVLPGTPGREAQNQGGIAVLATRASGLPTHSAAWN